MEEIWRNIDGYEGKYQVSNWGNVKSLNFLRSGHPGILSKVNTSTGYYYVTFSANGKRKNFKIHRLVATAFIPNPENKRTVNHFDGDTLNNYVGNLEWATHGQNHKHAYDVLGRKSHHKGKYGHFNGKSKPVNQFTKDGVFLQTWESANHAERITHIHASTISLCCCNRPHAKTAGGFTWQFAEPVPE